jgi:long-subunit acyl-CoA synthetase (AMP-forming)
VAQDESPFVSLQQELEKVGTVDDLYRRSVERFPRRIFIRAVDNTGGQVRVTYAESAQLLAAITLCMRDLQFMAQDRIICYLEEQIPSIWFFLACAHLGVVPVPMSPVYSVKAVQELAESVNARAVFTVPEYVPRFMKCGIKILSLPHPSTKFHGVVELGMEPLPSAQNGLEMLQELARSRNADDVFSIQPTSGSTGRPKLVIRSHRSVLRSGLAIAFGIRPENEPPQRLLMISPLTHGNGRQVLTLALYLAAQLAIPTGVGTSARLDEIRRLDPTYIHLVPRMLRELYRQHLASGAKLDDPLFGSSAALMVIVGAAPDPTLLRILACQGIDIIPGYGSGETGHVSLGERGAWREGYAGLILPDVEAKLDNDGELLVRSPGIMHSYYGDEEETKAAFTEDEFYRTGDYAEITTDGYLRIIGRKKDCFNTYDGSNIYPGLIEERIEGLTWVRQVVLIGNQRPYLVALIVPQGEFASVAPGDGFLDEAAHGLLYSRARLDLQRINKDFEPNERVRAFALFGRAFTSELYTVLNRMKVKRNRGEVERAYQEQINTLYTSPPFSATVPDQQSD